MPATAVIPSTKTPRPNAIATQLKVVERIQCLKRRKKGDRRRYPRRRPPRRRTPATT